ncbi:MAG: hypothetical protein Q7K11_00390 [Candidatus Berkelbacteria bacterium]|nr:hypothetical protein [Candidatus Berkelbacteria bacterium]
MENIKQNSEQAEKEKSVKREELIAFEATRRNHAPLYMHTACESELEMNGYGDWTICPTHGKISAFDRKTNPRHKEEYQRMLDVVKKEFDEADALEKKKASEFQAIEDSAIQYTLEDCPRCKGAGEFINRYGETVSCHHKIYP